MQHDAPARWWHPHGDGVVCRLCPHACLLDNSRPEGRCGQRFWNGSELRTRGVGGAVVVHLDPVEKKPLYHFLPSSQTFSLGMTGCNLDCLFCQNWTLSADRSCITEWNALSPGNIASRALALGARSVAFTYNEPLITAEYWMEVAEECHRQGLRTIAVSNGYATPTLAREFYGAMDAANIDLKSFRDAFYRDICGARLAPVLHTLKEIHAQGTCHLEITTLLIPGKNDSAEEIVEMCRWIMGELGADVPLHFSAWHPDYQALDWPTEYITNPMEARHLAMAEGLHYVYTGNIHDRVGSITQCPSCNEKILERDGFVVLENRLENGHCPHCKTAICGVW